MISLGSVFYTVNPVITSSIIWFSLVFVDTEKLCETAMVFGF